MIPYHSYQLVQSNKPVAHRPNLVDSPKKLLVAGERERYAAQISGSASNLVAN